MRATVQDLGCVSLKGKLKIAFAETVTTESNDCELSEVLMKVESDKSLVIVHV